MLMAKTLVKPVFFFFTLILAAALESSSALTILEHEQNVVVSTYIVHVEEPAALLDLEVLNDDDLQRWYMSFLPQTMSSDRMVHSYRSVLTGFAVKLTASEAKALTLVNGVVSVRQEQTYSLLTTHTPSFLGLRRDMGPWKDTDLGKGVIVGLLDTGIFPDHPSFSDKGMQPPPPAKWKGRCDFNATLCNNKLIGARSFVTEDKSVAVAPFDEIGHGTHTSSTAAGNFVVDANALGQANGTASGMAPLAHLAMYQVCSIFSCLESDVLAAMDAAIGDGVDVLSLSIGGVSVPFYSDAIALGAFRAIQKGIFVSCSAGNSGPKYNTVINEAPWILTVGASTIDRTIKATARLGNGAEYDGESLFQPADFNSSKLLPLVYPGSNGDSKAGFCEDGSLRNADVKGKIVVCTLGGHASLVGKGQEVKDAGGAAMIMINDERNGFSTVVDAHVLPATHVSYAAGLEILAYINSTSNPTATILFKGTFIGDPTAPAMASFSSRGPSRQSPGILKPDITGPGVNILAAWPFALDNSTLTKANFNVILGTSMSCPHLSGVAALLKSSHPDWSPAAIKSAIMTSADIVNLEKKPIIDQTGLAADIFAVGAGHVNPSRAQNPGLIYDLTPEDYIPYLCGLGYSDKNIKTIVQTNVQCSQISAIPEAQLNYPSFSVILGPSPQNYSRTVTNVGHVNSTYTYKLDAPEGVVITVTPAELTFTETSRTATYTVTFSERVGRTGRKPFSQGALTWSSGQSSVRSPIAVLFHMSTYK